MATTPFELDELLKHSRFVKALALQLARDDDAADELAAQTMAVALAQQPETGPSLRAWLRRVMERLLSRERRDSERRTRRERAALETSGSLDATAPATVELVARIELEQKIAAAFSALAAPYKETLFQRFFDDLTPSAIAARDGISVDTVKTRLKRGLALLRDALDAGHAGRREGWRLRALQIASAGVPIVATKGKVAAVALAALLLAGATIAVIRPWSHDGDDARPVDPALARADGVERGEGDELEERDPAAAFPAARVDRSGLPFASGVVVDGVGAPLPGVRVGPTRLVRVKSSKRHFVSYFDIAAVAKETLATSDAEGRFTIAEAGDDLVAFWFLKEGFQLGEWFELEAESAANQQRRVVLRPSFPIRGTVSDTDGEPVPSAWLNFWTENVPRPGMRVARNLADQPEYVAHSNLTARTAADGSFDVRWIPWDSFSASANAEGYLSVLAASTQLRDPWDATLERSHLMIDVVDAGSGEPLPQASALVIDAASGSALESLVPSELDGHLGSGEAAVLQPPGRLYLRTGFGQPSDEYMPPWLKKAPDHRLDVRVHVLADGHRFDAANVTLAQSDEPPHLRFELVPDDGSPRPASIAGRVIGSAKVQVALHGLASNLNERALPMRSPLLTVTPALDGSFAFHDLPDGRYRLFVGAAGVAPHTLDVRSPSGGIVIELGPSATVECVVTDRAGMRASGARVLLQSEDGERAWSTTADHEGIARVEGLPEGALLVVAREPLESAAAEKVARPLEAECFDATNRVMTRAGETTRVELALLEPVPMRLHFERDDGTPVTNVTFEWIESGGAGLAGTRRLGLMNRLTVTPDSRGDAVVLLYPGHYVWRVSEAVAMRDVAFDVPRDGSGSATLRVPIIGSRGSLRGRIVDEVSGAPVARRDVLASQLHADGDRIELGMATSDFQGRFEFALLPVGRIDLLVRGGGYGGNGRRQVDDHESPYGLATSHAVVVAGQLTDVEIALPPVNSRGADFPRKAIELQVNDAESGRPLSNVILSLFAPRGDGDELFVGTLYTDAAGVARADLYAADRYRIRASRRRDPSVGTPAYPEQESEAESSDGALIVAIALARSR